MSTEMQAYQSGDMMTPVERITALKQNIQIVQSVMRDVMQIGEHYGTIPGTKKPSLFKAGAEKLSFTFRMAPEFEIKRIDFENGHREYDIVCRLASIETGKFLGSGVGLCTTMEKKYRYRDEYRPTGKQVPKAYWDNNRDKTALPPGTVPRKIDGKWLLCVSIQAENPDIADTYNTVLKMAKKRAFVDAVLQVTSASDIFTQDVEDIIEPEKPVDPPYAAPERQSEPAEP